MEAFRLSTRVRQATTEPVSARKAPVGAAPHATSVAVPYAVPYSVPWRVAARSRSGSIEIEHRGASPLRAVRFALAGGGMLGVSVPRTIHPGERLRVVLRGTHADGATAAADAMLVLRWLEPDGTELLWPVAL